MCSDNFSLDLIKRTQRPLKNVWKCYVRRIGEVSPGHSIELRLIHEDKLSGWVISETVSLHQMHSCHDHIHQRSVPPQPNRHSHCDLPTWEQCPQAVRACDCLQDYLRYKRQTLLCTRMVRTPAHIHVSFSHVRIYSDVPSTGAPQNWMRFSRSPPDLCRHLLQSGSLDCAYARSKSEARLCSKGLNHGYPHRLFRLAMAGPVPWGVTVRARLPSVDSPCHGSQSQSTLGLCVSRRLTRLDLH